MGLFYNYDGPNLPDMDQGQNFPGKIPFLSMKYAWNSCKNASLEFEWEFWTFWSKVIFQVHHPFKLSIWPDKKSPFRIQGIAVTEWKSNKKIKTRKIANHKKKGFLVGAIWSTLLNHKFLVHTAVVNMGCYTHPEKQTDIGDGLETSGQWLREAIFFFKSCLNIGIAQKGGSYLDTILLFCMTKFMK